MMIDDQSLGNLKDVEEPKEEIHKGPPVPEDAVAAYILKRYRQFDDDKNTSGAEQEIINSLAAFNLEYSEEDLQKIAAEGSSPIYIGLTATKARALSAFIKDILLSSTKPYDIQPTKVPSIPKKVEDQVVKYFEKQMEAVATGEDLKKTNEAKRDMELSLIEEINAIAKHEFTKIEAEIEDNLQEGSFYSALSDFIDDFAIYPTAILKGPIVTKKNKLTWMDGAPVLKEEFVFFNRRVNPLDFYPSPDKATFVEKLRFSLEELSQLEGIPGYDIEVIREAIDNPQGTQNSLFTRVDQTIRDQEMQGGLEYEEEVHGIHWHGAIPASVLGERVAAKGTIVNVEAILIGDKVLKLSLNTDPLGRSPYYWSSFQTKPGSFWGTSLAKVINPEQRLCNATVRALALNLGLSASPQAMITIDRLADNGDIDEIYGGKIWQVKSDPSGNSGRPIDFFNIPSNANELLGVFNRFMELADDTSGIPRYTYGGSNTQGAGATSSGLAMLIESATKTIKQAIRGIDQGVIVPRVETEFYVTMLKSKSKYTGDISVVAKGSQSLTNKAAESLKRNEFLQITANERDQRLMGDEGRSVLLRQMSSDMGLPESIVPNRMELKQIQEDQAKAAQAQQELEKMKINVPLEVAKLQGEYANKGQSIVAQTKEMEAQVDKLENDQDFQISQGTLVVKQQDSATMAKSASDATEQRREAANRSVALSLKTIGMGQSHDKSQT